MFFGGGVEHTIEAWDGLQRRITGHGRTIEGFGADYVALSGGNVVELIREIDAWRAAGGTHLSVATMGLGLDSVDAHVDYIASLAELLGLS